MGDRTPEQREDLKLLLRRMLGDAAKPSGLESASPAAMESAFQESTGDPVEVADAMAGLESLRDDDEFTPEQAVALEAIVLTRERPVVDILSDTYHSPPRPWRHLDKNPFRAKLEAAIPSIGRVEIPNHPTKPFGGTAFVVGENLLMTNRHVAETFATGRGLTSLHFIPGRSPGIDFEQEIIPKPRLVLDFDSVVLVHPFWDCALVRVEGLPDTRAPLQLMGSEMDNLEDSEVAIVGYPAMDSRNDQALQMRIFRHIFDRKRLQPGRLRGYKDVVSYNHFVTALKHDASTLGGNSGSAIIDVKSGQIVGLHFGGTYLKSNYAVPVWALAEDPRVRDAGVNFTQPVPTNTETTWDEHWTVADTVIEAAPPGPGDSAAVGNGGTPSDLEWYERSDDAALRAAYLRDPGGTARRLARVLGMAEAQDLIEDLMPPVPAGAEITEGWFTKDVDPNLPEIIYLHGIMGSHLENAFGLGMRVWFNALSFAAGNVAEKMTLEDDGYDDSYPGIRLDPDGHLKLQYGKAARKWRKRGFAVHDFAYDWRKPVEASADQLHAFIEQHQARRPGKRYALVAHSMGGLISSIYAARHAEWEQRIQKAIFVGSPLGGSYAPLEAVLGVYPFFTTLARISRNDDIPDLQRLARTLPGLIDMLPNPELFAADPDYYQSGTWHENEPLQKWLDASRARKAAILASPLLARTSGIVCGDFGTVASASVVDGKLVAGTRDAVGDGTVPLRAAAVKELADLYRASGKRHADMMKNMRIVQAVGDLLKHGATTAVDPVALADIDFDAVVVAPEAPEFSDEALAGIRERMESGNLTSADMYWIFEPLSGDPPA